MGTSSSTPARAEPRAAERARQPHAEQSTPGITVALPDARQPHTYTLLGPYTDGGPFVYTPPIAAPESTAVELRVEYIDAYLSASVALSPYTTVRLERKDTLLSARLVAPVGTALDAYLIARSAFHLAADGHFGELSEVRFYGFDAARKDVERLKGDTMPTQATEQAIRAMPARGPCVLDRLAEWQLKMVASKRIVSREVLYENMRRFINHPINGSVTRQDIRIPVFSTEKAQMGRQKEEKREAVEFARRHIEGTVHEGRSGPRIEGRLFLEPFWTPDGATSLVSWMSESIALRGGSLASDSVPLRGGSLANVVSPEDGLRVASALRDLQAYYMPEMQVAYPAADPIAVYVRRSGPSGQGPEEHWLLRAIEGSGGVVPTRAWVHLAPRAYLFGVEGSVRADLGLLRMLSAMYTPRGARSAIDAAAHEWARSEVSLRELPKEANKKAWAGVGWHEPSPMLLDEATPRVRAWRASGLFAPQIRHARLLLSIQQLIGTRGIVAMVQVPGHAMCGVLVVSRTASSGSRITTARLLVRNSYPRSEGTEFTSQFNQDSDEEIPLTVEYVTAPDAHYTQEREGSCGYHAMMFAVYLLDVAETAVRSGNIDAIRAIMNTRPPPLYALVVRRILVYYVREDNVHDFSRAPLKGTVKVETERVLELGVRDPRLAEREATTALGLYPVSVRLPGFNGAVVSFKFHVRAQLFIRVDAFIDANSSVLLVLDGNVTAATHDLMIYRCLSFARFCVLKIYPGQLVSSPVPRVDGIITKRPSEPPQELPAPKLTKT
jgi:hypothetical protein